MEFTLSSALKTFAASAAAGLLLAAQGAHALEPVKVQILSATVKDKQIEGATVTVQKNGEQSATAVTNAQGQVQFTDPGALSLPRRFYRASQTPE